MQILLLLTTIHTQPQDSDKQILQAMLNGIFQQNSLPQPTTILPCVDDDSAYSIVVFIGLFLDKASRALLQDLIVLPQLLKDFIASLPPQLPQCLTGNPQLQALKVAYGVADKLDEQILLQAVEYAAVHYMEVHRWMVDLDSLWRESQAYQTGRQGAIYAHKMFGWNGNWPLSQ